jgi:hypothetical protein
MQNLLEDKNNLNHDTFIIPAQEGGSEDDRYLASIGDAVQQHVYSLDSSKRQLWDSLLHMDNTGAIFRIEDSPFHRDLDPFNLEKEEDLEKAFQLKIMTAFKGKDVDPEFVQVLKDEFEKEVERRQESEDIADIGVPIPYHDWEKFPQMHKHWDIQPTPKPLFIYMGSSRPWFYDEMPEYHPDKSKIEKVLQVFNRDWDEITEEFVDWVNDNIINEMFFKDPMVPRHLYGMALALEEGHIPPEQAVSEALKAIDASYQETYKTNSLKIRDEDPIHQILNMNTEVWREQAKQGLKPFNSVKKLGYTLYKDHLDKTSTSHWTRYKGLKKEFAPVISFKNIDLNRASVYELKQTLNVTDFEARNIWFARPFYNLGTLINKGYLSPSRVTKNPQTEKTLNLIENKLALAIQEEDGQILTKLGKVLRGIEVKGLTKISKDEWQTIWFYYRAAKGEIFNVLNEIERRKKNDAKKEESTS